MSKPEKDKDPLADIIREGSRLSYNQGIEHAAQLAVRFPNASGLELARLIRSFKQAEKKHPASSDR